MITRHILGALLAALFAASAAAQSILGGVAAAGELPARVTMHSGWAEPDGRRIVGLRMDLDRGWKTYWRSPGAAGIPPSFDWTGSRNVAEARIVWPRPVVFESFGMRTIGYKDQMVLPIALKAEDPALPIRLRLSLIYGLCEEICIPAQQDFALDIAPGEAPQGAELIAQALADGPRQAGAAGLVQAKCAMRPGERAFEARLAFATPFASSPVVVAEGDGAVFGPLDSRLDGASVIAAGEMRAEGGWIDRSAVRLTVLGPDGAYLVSDCASG